MRWLRQLFGGATALVGAVLAAWHGVAVYYLVTGRIEAIGDQPPLGFSLSVALLGVFMLVGGYWAGREGPP